MINISFADLTHTGQIVAANTIPLGISYVASTAKQHFGKDLSVDIFKYPSDFNNYLNKTSPDICCFSSFSWNIRLAHEYAKELKKKNKNIVTVFGGPNFPSDSKEQVEFLTEFNSIDFFIEFEGEFNLIELLEKIFDLNFDLRKLKEQKFEISILRYIYENEFIKNSIKKKIRDLNSIPSPYLNNMMDKFFDDILIPVIQTTRGCPYTCAFCWEGGEYFRKTNRFDLDRVFAEMEYIAKKSKVKDLQITDANFGMFKDDILTAKEILKLQSKYNYPQTVLAATAKNHKERTVEIVEMLGDTLPATAAVQSTDANVLKNINRGNVSQDTLMTMGKAIEKRGGQSEAEIILCLEGDTKEKHTKTINDMLDADMKFIRMYQFMMLPGTKSASVQSRIQYGMKTKYRVLPRCFGIYDILGEQIPVAEIEEICIATKSMPYDDYLAMRNLHLTVEIFNNDSIFLDLIQFLKLNQIERSTFIKKIHNAVFKNSTLKKLYEDFNKEEDVNLSTKSSLIKKTKNSKTIHKYINGELGTNELYKYRVLGIFYNLDVLHELAFDVAVGLLKLKNNFTSLTEKYLIELFKFSKLRKDDPLNFDLKKEGVFTYNFIELLKSNFMIDPNKYKLAKPVNFTFYHNDSQKEIIDAYIKQYGKSDIGLGRIVLRANMNRLYRSVSTQGLENYEPMEEEYNKRTKQKMIA